MSDPVKFIQLVSRDCKKHGVKLNLIPKRRYKLSKTESLAGLWDEETLTITVATYNDDWLTTLAHEYSHFCQWKNNEFSSDEVNDAFADFDEWIDGKLELSDERLKEAITVIQDCELDCEKKTLDLIKKYNLFDKPELYIKKSNAYVLSYEIIKLTRKNIHHSGHGSSKILKLMPKTFIEKYELSEELRQLFIEKCYKK